MQTVCVGTGDMLNPSYNGAQTITTNDQGTASTRTVSTQTSITMTGCSAGNLLFIQIGRDTTDTNTATASLIGVELTTRKTPQS